MPIKLTDEIFESLAEPDESGVITFSGKAIIAEDGSLDVIKINEVPVEYEGKEREEAPEEEVPQEVNVDAGDIPGLLQGIP